MKILHQSRAGLVWQIRKLSISYAFADSSLVTIVTDTAELAISFTSAILNISQHPAHVTQALCKGTLPKELPDPAG